jgi:hypothetical protein
LLILKKANGFRAVFGPVVSIRKAKRALLISIAFARGPVDFEGLTVLP